MLWAVQANPRIQFRFPLPSLCVHTWCNLSNAILPQSESQKDVDHQPRACPDSALQVGVPVVDHRQIVLIAQDYAEQNNIDPPIILGLMWTESKMQPHLVHGKDGGSPSYGLGQLKYKYMHKVWPQCAYLTADPKLGPKHLLIPEINICLIAAILNKHRRRYGSRALTVYNCGPKRCKHMKREPRAVHAYWRHAKWMRREGESQLAKLPPLISDTDIFVMPRDIPKEPVVK